MYKFLSNDLGAFQYTEVTAGCQLPYTLMNGVAYSRAYLMKMNLPGGQRDSYVPDADAQAGIDWWRSLGLDPFLPISQATAESIFHCEGAPTQPQYNEQVALRARVNALIAANEALVFSTPILHDTAQQLLAPTAVLTTTMVDNFELMISQNKAIVVRPPIIDVALPPTLKPPDVVLPPTPATPPPTVVNSSTGGSLQVESFSPGDTYSGADTGAGGGVQAAVASPGANKLLWVGVAALLLLFAGGHND